MIHFYKTDFFSEIPKYNIIFAEKNKSNGKFPFTYVTMRLT